jgi:hypothetical protein
VASEGRIRNLVATLRAEVDNGTAALYNLEAGDVVIPAACITVEGYNYTDAAPLTFGGHICASTGALIMYAHKWFGAYDKVDSLNRPGAVAVQVLDNLFQNVPGQALDLRLLAAAANGDTDMVDSSDQTAFFKTLPQDWKVEFRTHPWRIDRIATVDLTDLVKLYTECKCRPGGPYSVALFNDNNPM